MAMTSLFIEWLLHIVVVIFSVMILLLTEFGKSDSSGVSECMGEFQLGPER